MPKPLSSSPPPYVDIEASWPAQVFATFAPSSGSPSQGALEMSPLPARAPSCQKRPSSPPAPQAPGAGPRPEKAAPVPGEALPPLWNAEPAYVQPLAAFDAADFVRVQSTQRRRCRTFGVVLGVLVVAGVVAGTVLGIQRQQSDPSIGAPLDVTPTASAPTATPSAAGARPTFTGLAAGTYTFNGLGTDDTCSEAGMGITCPPQNTLTTFRFDGGTGAYSVFDVTGGVALTVLPQSTPRELRLLGRNDTTTSASGCALTESRAWHLTLSPQSFAITTLVTFANADTAPCADDAFAPSRVGALTCHCQWTGSSAAENA